MSTQPVNGVLPTFAVGSTPFTELDARRLGFIRRFFLRHPRVMDWLVALLYVVSVLLSPSREDTTILRQVALALAGGVTLLARRRAPIAVAVAITAISVTIVAVTGHTYNTQIGLAFACYAVAVAYPPIITWLTAAGMLVANGCAALLWHRADVSFSYTLETGSGSHAYASRYVTILGAVVFMLVGLAIGASVRARRTHIGDLIERANAVARERDQEGQLAAARERTRIAREMHDVVAHSLTVMITLADGAKATPDRALAQTALDEVTTTGRAALTDMRRVLGVLRDDDDAPLAPHAAQTTLDQIIEPFRTAGLPVRIVRTGPAVTLPSDVRHAAQRIVTEALTNVLRYAPLAPTAEVRIRERPDGDGKWLDLRIINTAGPADGAARATIGSGHGIIGMKERAAMYQGTAVAGPTSTGWEVSASLRLVDDPAKTTMERVAW